MQQGHPSEGAEPPRVRRKGCFFGSRPNCTGNCDSSPSTMAPASKRSGWKRRNGCLRNACGRPRGAIRRLFRHVRYGRPSGYAPWRRTTKRSPQCYGGSERDPPDPAAAARARARLWTEPLVLSARSTPLLWGVVMNSFLQEIPASTTRPRPGRRNHIMLSSFSNVEV